MKRHTLASCFATFVVPHLLFVDDFEERNRIVKVASLAWNIALFPDADLRERHIAKVFDVIRIDAAGAPPEFEDGFKGDLRMLVGRKRDLFPWLLDNVLDAGLQRARRMDVLVIATARGKQRIDVATNPTIEALPMITKVLVQAHMDTTKQRQTLERARGTLGLLGRIVTPEMVTAYCVQRADLLGYHRMLATWRSAPMLAGAEATIDRFLDAINEIEDDSKAVLAILAEALDLSHRM